MSDFRRSGPEPPPGMPQLRHEPGAAAALLAELAPFLAEEGIDVDNLDGCDMAGLQAAMGRAVERRELVRFTPVGKVRAEAASVLRRVAEALQEGDTRAAAQILDGVPPEATEAVTVAACIGLGLGRLDEWLAGRGPGRGAPAGLGQEVRVPGGHWVGERAATDLLALARKGRAFDSLGAVITRQGGYQVLFGTALAVAAVLQAWSRLTGTGPADLAREHLR